MNIRTLYFRHTQRERKKKRAAVQGRKIANRSANNTLFWMTFFLRVLCFVLFFFRCRCAFLKTFRNAQIFTGHVFISVDEYTIIIYRPFIVLWNVFHFRPFIFALRLESSFFLPLLLLIRWFVLSDFQLCSYAVAKKSVCVCNVSNCFAWIHMSNCVHSLTSTKNTYHRLLTLGFSSQIEKQQKVARNCLIFGCRWVRLTAIKNRQYGVCYLLKLIFFAMSMREFVIRTYVKLNDKYLFERKNSSHVQKKLYWFLWRIPHFVFTLIGSQISGVCQNQIFFCESRMKKESDIQ